MSDAALPQVGHPRGASIKTVDAIAALVAAKRSANFRPRYVNSLRSYLGLFARGRQDVPLSEIKVEDLERWFAKRNEAPSSQRGNLGRLGSLFAFAERRDWIAKNPMRQLEKIRIDRKPPKILTVDEAERLMEFATHRHPRALAFFSLALLGGIRPEEIEGVTWANVGQGTVTIDSAASKTRRRRIVHLRESAIEWLAFARGQNSLLPFDINKRVRLLQKAAEHLGFEDGWCQDILRHTAASMWLADTKEVGAVARELGNSPAILLTHYYEIVTAEQAAAFWSIRPDWLYAMTQRWNSGREGELTLQDRQVLSLCSEGWNVREVANMLSLNPGAVARIRRQAMCRLLAMLTQRATLEHKEKQAAILNCVVNHQPGTLVELGRQFDIPRPTLDSTLKFLRAKMAWQNGKLTAAGAFKRLVKDNANHNLVAI